MGRGQIAKFFVRGKLSTQLTGRKEPRVDHFEALVFAAIVRVIEGDMNNPSAFAAGINLREMVLEMT